MTMFAATDLVRQRERKERWVVRVLGAMTVSMIVPLVAIIGYLFVQAAPSLSIAFLLEPPRDMQTAGGIWPALIGVITPSG